MIGLERHSVCIAIGLLLAAAVAADETRSANTATNPRPWVVPTAALPERPFGVRQIGYDARYLARRPFSLGPRGRRKLLAIAGSAVALYVAREEIRDAVQRNRSPGRSEILDDARTMGKGAFAPAAALIALGSSLITHDDRERETALMLLESMAFSAASAYGGSFVLAAERPEDGDSITWLDSDGRGVSLDSALAASVIAPLRRQYLQVRADDSRGRRLWKRTATVLLYSGAVLTALQRLDQDKHWAPDAFLGFAAGHGVGKAICDAHDEVRRKRELLPALAPTDGGATATWTFPLRARRRAVSP